MFSKAWWVKACNKASDLMVKYSPPWLKNFKEKHPKWFWVFVVFLVVLPMGVTAFIASQIVWMSLMWLFTATR